MQKILLYYIFTPLTDPEAIRLWQRSLCERLMLKGRILISEQGINGTVGGDIKDLKAYIKATKSYAPFHAIGFKWSEGGHDDFPKLVVKVRSELVTFGASAEIQVNTRGVVGGGKRLKPEQVHELIEKRGDEVVFFDGRNAHEAKIGKFKNAVVASVEHTRDFVKELESDKYNDIKDKAVVTYCTGGIRCEILSVLMKNRGFKEVYQIDGGIVTYGQTFGDDGLWEGALYMFDKRLGVGFSERAADIGRCVHCDAATSNYENCTNLVCNNLILVCEQCDDQRLCPKCVSLHLNESQASVH